MGLDIFEEINNAILDLQSSELQTFEWSLKRLNELLNDEVLKVHNDELTENLNLEKLLEDSSNTGGSFVGSSKLLLPTDMKERLGYIILLVNWLSNDTNEVLDFCHHYFYSGNKIIAGIHSFNRQVLIPFARDYKNYITRKGANMEVKNSSIVSNNVFIVHGRDDLLKVEVARFIEKLGLSAIILHEQPNSGKTIIEKIEEYTNVGFGIVLYTPCDIGGQKLSNLDTDLKPRARQNVVFEHGYLIGKLGRNKVCALVKEEVEFPSDISGVVYQKVDDAGAWKLKLAIELKQAGYSIDLNILC